MALRDHKDFRVIRGRKAFRAFQVSRDRQVKMGWMARRASKGIQGLQDRMAWTVRLVRKVLPVRRARPG